MKSLFLKPLMPTSIFIKTEFGPELYIAGVYLPCN